MGVVILIGWNLWVGLRAAFCMFLEQRSAKNREVNRRYKLLKARRAMEEGSDDDGSSDDETRDLTE